METRSLHKIKLENRGDERRDAACEDVSFQTSDDIILNHWEKVSLNKPLQCAQPPKPHPGVSQQHVNLVTALEMRRTAVLV